MSMKRAPFRPFPLEGRITSHILTIKAEKGIRWWWRSAALPHHSDMLQASSPRTREEVFPSR